VTRALPTAEFSSLVHGVRGIGADDPAETFHEASRLYPNVVPGRLGALLAIAGTPELQQTITRAARLHPDRPAVPLPVAPLPPARLRRVLARRQSRLGPRRPLELRDLAALLGAAYAATERDAGQMRRPVPSAGALYPLELYVLPLSVAGLDAANYHYDPFRHRLERLDDLSEHDVAAALVDPTLVDAAAAVVVITAMFWRSRFKYGLRGYRFALLEAGHVMQNAVLAATALRLPALPLGGFYDTRLEALVGADGLEEAAIYALLLGGRP
jgi:SagB-type dehydrogenase family enzyme